MIKPLLKGCFYSGSAALITCFLALVFSSAVPGTLSSGEQQIGQAIISVVFLFPINIAACFFASYTTSKVVPFKLGGAGVLIFLSSLIVQLLLIGFYPLLAAVLLVVSITGSINGAKVANA
ncbi:hypothetical protein [Marinimicrobium sp. LS-A18]|uniref:hypothetical protein n=1 Tax=Marinimicrobium sp. LS-A18 TaxID=1381596 RepID=UPI00126846F6|nr:hypothetical protein [Marinimicrobium sp. LS-A18]